MNKWIKRIIIVLLIIILCVILYIVGNKVYNYLRIKNAKIEVTLTNDLKLEFNDNRKVSDYIESINGKIEDDYTIDSSKVGNQKVKFDFVNDDGIKVSYEYEIEVVDTVEPVIWLGEKLRLKKGTKKNIADMILCGDNYDSNPNCFIEGDYDPDGLGDYDLVFKAIDKSGNVATQPFKLTIYENSEPATPSVKTKKLFSDVVNEYKKDNTSFGIDVSKWQGDINFEELKNDGVEFIIIRVGTTRNGEYYLDPKFERNISEANKYGIKVGLYFFSYSTDIKKSREEALWVIDQIKDYKVDLPIAFDWEDWSNFNDYNISFYELSMSAKAFLDTIKEHGYDGMLYSSKSYLEYMWFPLDYDVWLAHYTDKTTYKGKYKFWQLCDNGVVDGIRGNVDINIMYE